MPYTLVISPKLNKVFSKLSKKDPLQFEILTRKLGEILENPQAGKPLTANMSGQWRIHIRHFVLTYQILENEKIIKLLDYNHHDKVYKN